MKILLILTAAAVASCSPEIRTYTELNQSYDVAKFQTYRWSEQDLADLEGYPLYYNELNDKRIRGAVNDLLRVRGYALSDSITDLTLVYNIKIEERSVLVPDPYGYMYGDYFMRPRPNIFKYREGRLTLDFIKTADGELVWRGLAVGALEVVIYETNDVDPAIKSAIAKILKDFPVSAKGKQKETTAR